MAEGHSNRWLHVIVVLFLIFAALMVMNHVGLLTVIETPPQPPGPTNYTTLICDDAYQTEKHYENEDKPYVDIPLQAGCFGGFVVVPSNWSTWQGQFLHNDPTDWAAYWFQGQYKPMGPYSQTQINSGRLQFGRVSNAVRLQGKGILRFYRITTQ